MSRLVEHDATGPLRLDESDLDAEKGDIAVCRCGLSGDCPFCDGTHRETGSEADDACYRYDREDGELRRRAVNRVVYADEEAESVGKDGESATVGEDADPGGR